MLQKIDGRDVFITNYTGWCADLPITWETEEERPYAIALDSLIKAGIVKSAGKYGVYITKHEKTENLTFHAYLIKE